MMEDFINFSDLLVPVSICSTTKIDTTSDNCILLLPDLGSVNFDKHPFVIPRVDFVDGDEYSKSFMFRECISLGSLGTFTKNIITTNQ